MTASSATAPQDCHIGVSSVDTTCFRGHNVFFITAALVSLSAALGQTLSCSALRSTPEEDGLSSGHYGFPGSRLCEQQKHRALIRSPDKSEAEFCSDTALEA